MKKIDVIYNLYGYIDEVSDNSIHFEQENESLQINATIETDKKVRAYIKAPNNNSTVTDELTPVGGVYSCTVEGAYMSKGTLYIGYELYDDTGYIERLEPLKIYIDSFVSLDGSNSDNVYVVTITVGNVETVPFEESASVENTGTKKDMILNFKIPRGETGLKGEKGDKGDKGDTGAQGIQGMQGEKGDKGDKGEQGIQGIQGEKGDRGNDGYTPIKGVDYFTEEDIKSLGIDDKVEKIDFNLLSEDVVYLQDSTEFRLSNKVDKEEGKGLSSNDFTDDLKERLEDNTFDYVLDDSTYYNSFEEFLENFTPLWDREGINKVIYRVDGETYYGIVITRYNHFFGLDIHSIFITSNGEIWEYYTEEDNGIERPWKKISVSKTDLDKKVDKVAGRQLSAIHYVDLGNLGDSEITEHLNEFKSYGMYHLTYNESTTYGVGQALMSVHGNVDEGIVSQTLYRFIGGVQNDILYRDYDETEGVWGDWQAQYLNEKRARDIYTTKTDLDKAIGDIETSLENIIQKYGLGGDSV